jgi:alpha-L-fucosidase 2
LHDAKNAYHIYRKLLSYVSPDGYHGSDARRGGGTYPNLLDAHSPFQIDGNFGGCAGVVEMLMQSDFSLDGNGLPVVAIELLPALPANWKDGSVKGLRARGGYTVDITWRDGQVINYRIRNSHGGTVTMRYNGKEELVKADKE